MKEYITALKNKILRDIQNVEKMEYNALQKSGLIISFLSQ
jgi:hypothetical protein